MVDITCLLTQPEAAICPASFPLPKKNFAKAMLVLASRQRKLSNRLNFTGTKHSVPSRLAKTLRPSQKQCRDATRGRELNTRMSSFSQVPAKFN